jgi:hypothetical protein
MDEDSAAGVSVRIGPQPGPQSKFLATSADIAIYGGSAGGGKTFAELLEPLRHAGNKEFGAVIFRRTTPQITNEGALGMRAESFIRCSAPSRTKATYIGHFSPARRFRSSTLSTTRPCSTGKDRKSR